MSDQAQSPQAAGGDQSLDSLYANAVQFQEVPEGQDWNDDDVQQNDLPDGDQQDGDDQPQTEPLQQDQSKQSPQQGLSNEQVLQLFAQQHQWNQQALPVMIATAVKETIAALGFQPPAAPAPQDPYAGIDPEAPDAEWQRMQIHNRLLQERIDKLEGKWQQTEQTWQQQQQQAQQQAQQQQFVGWVNENVSKGTDYFFQGWPETPQTAALKQMAATQIDAEWSRNGYTQEGFTKAVQAVRPHIEAIKQFKPAAQAQGANVNRSPGAGQRPGQGASPTAPQQRTWSNPNEFWEQGPMSAANIMNRMRGPR